MKAIVTKYRGPTDRRGSRITAKADGASVAVPYKYGSHNPHHDAALALCRKMGWTGDLICGGMPDGDGNVYVFANDEVVKNPV